MNLDGASTAALARPPPGWESGYKWPQTGHWLDLKESEDARPAAGSVVGAKLVDAATVGRFCEGASLAWRCCSRAPRTARLLAGC